MRQPDNQIGLGKHLAKRLYPVTLVIGFLISVGLPATYYVLESNALRHTATIYAQNLSEKLRDLVLEAPALWKYQTYQYGRILDDLISRKDVTFIRVLDEAGRPVTGYEHTTAKAEAWWNRYALVASAPILFNNRTVGTVQVGLSQGPLLGVTLALLLLSTTVGVGLAVLVYSFPVRVIRGMEGKIQNLLAEREARAEEAEARSHQLEAARAVTEDVTRELDLTALLGLINRRAAELVGAVSGTVYFWDEATRTLSPQAWYGLGEWMKEVRIRLGEGVTGAVAKRREGMIVNDYRTSPHASPLFLERSGITAVVAEPLLYRDRFLGVIAINNEGTGRLFTQEDRELLALFANQAAVAIANARLFAESESLRGAAEASAQRFSDLVEGLDAIVWEADAETFQFSFVSQRAEALLGYPVEQWLEEPGFWADHIYPDDREWAVALCRQATSEGRDHQFEYRALAADGRVIWLRDIVRVVRDDSGRTRQLRGVMVEITERKRAEQRQATQFAVTRILAESATVGEATSNLLQAICEGVEWDLGELWRHDTTDDVLRRESAWHSPSLPLEEFEEISRGLTFSRGIGLPGIVWDTGQPLWETDVDTDPKFPRMQAAVRAGLHAACGFPVRTGGRVTGVMVFFSRMLRESDEDLLRMMDDIGSQIGQFIERKEAEQALARRTRELEGLHEIAQAFATMTDPRETYGRLARLVAELVGATKCVIGLYDPKERTIVSQAPGYGITDELVAAFCYPVDEVRSAWNFRLHGPLLANDRALILPFFKRFVEPFGCESIVVVPMRIEGRVTGLIYALNKPGGFSEDDVKLLSVFASQAAVVIENARLFAEREAQAAALQEAAQRLEAKNQELEAFVYTVTHDLRAPLVALQGMASMLAEAKGTQLDDEGRHYLDRLVANTAHMEELIRNLLEFSRVGRLRKAPEAVAVAEVVDCLLLQWGDLLRERGVKVVCRDLPVLWGERIRLEQVYQNLLGNALKFLGAENPAPMIEVGAEDRGEEWECYVKDNGIGIDPAYHGKVFELFQRLREVEAEGTGIGLAIAKKIVDLAGGTMWIESEAGKGATFRFTWPKGVREESERDHG